MMDDVAVAIFWGIFCGFSICGVLCVMFYLARAAKGLANRPGLQPHCQCWLSSYDDDGICDTCALEASPERLYAAR